METRILTNGMRLAVASVNASVVTLSATINVGHINEPKQGLAAIFEKILMYQEPAVQAVYGGTITSFLTGCDKENLKETMEKLAKLVKSPELSEELLQRAKAEIVHRTKELDQMPARQSKLAYKHTAFGEKEVWNTEEYISSVKNISVEDLYEFKQKYYTGRNIVLCIAGQKLDADEIETMAEVSFGDLPEGIFHRVKKEFYTGGYAEVPTTGTYQRVMFGWDVTALSNVAEANVLMSALNGRLERAFASAESRPALKIAGYFGGMRTLRISVETWNEQENLNEVVEKVAKIVHDLQNEQLNEAALESARQWAMTEKLFKFASPNDASVETAWQILGREKMYNIDDRIIATWRVSARNVQEIAKEIFSTPLTLVICSNQQHLSYEEVVEKL